MNIKLLLVLLFTVFFLNFYSFGQDQNSVPTSETIVVRVYEGSTLTSPSYMVISYDDGRLEEVPLSSIGVNTKGARKNVQTIHAILGKMLADGYVIISSAAGGVGVILTNTYILTKKK